MKGESAAESSSCQKFSLSFTEMDPSLELMRQLEELNGSSMEMMGCFSGDYSLTHHQQPDLFVPFPDHLQLPSSLPKVECPTPALLAQPMASAAEEDRKKKSLEALDEGASADHSLSGLTQTKIQRNKNSSESRKRGRGKSKEADKAREVVHVRARRGQATDSHSLAERSRRERINERMRFLQDLVPGCYKSMGMAGMLDEIINYVQSLQNQVEFLSLKLSAASSLYDVYCSNDAEAFATPQLQGGNGQETVARMMGDECGGELTGFFSAIPL